ncbi:hypothetical protein ACQKWADRAFT_8750 [Trichoderma austrokoningii]
MYSSRREPYSVQCSGIVQYKNTLVGSIILDFSWTRMLYLETVNIDPANLVFLLVQPIRPSHPSIHSPGSLAKNAGATTDDRKTQAGMGCSLGTRPACYFSPIYPAPGQLSPHASSEYACIAHIPTCCTRFLFMRPSARFSCHSFVGSQVFLDLSEINLRKLQKPSLRALPCALTSANSVLSDDGTVTRDWAALALLTYLLPRVPEIKQLIIHGFTNLSSSQAIHPIAHLISISSFYIIACGATPTTIILEKGERESRVAPFHV